MLNSVIDSHAKFSYTNTEIRDCLNSNRNLDKKSNNILNKHIDLSYLNFSKIEYQNNIIKDEVYSLLN